MWRRSDSTTTHTHTHPFNGLFPGLPRWASTRQVKPIWILLKQETVSGSGISWAICKSAHCSRQTTTPTPHHSVFIGWMPFLLPNQQRQSTDKQAMKSKWLRYLLRTYKYHNSATIELLFSVQWLNYKDVVNVLYFKIWQASNEEQDNIEQHGNK